LLVGDSGRAVVVSGEPGVGKTALIEQLCTFAVSEGWRVVRVQGSQAEESFALGGLNQLVLALRDCQAGLDEHDREVLAPVLIGDSGTEVSVLPLGSRGRRESIPALSNFHRRTRSWRWPIMLRKTIIRPTQVAEIRQTRCPVTVTVRRRRHWRGPHWRMPDAN
jgi:GTPase SAR1 family protein